MFCVKHLATFLSCANLHNDVLPRHWSAVRARGLLIVAVKAGSNVVVIDVAVEARSNVVVDVAVETGGDVVIAEACRLVIVVAETLISTQVTIHTTGAQNGLQYEYMIR